MMTTIRQLQISECCSSNDSSPHAPSAAHRLTGSPALPSRRLLLLFAFQSPRAMAQGSGSYYEDYMRSSALSKHCGGGGSGSDPALGARNAKKLLTDRGAYISFLEVQLERVSAACLTTQTFEARLAALEGAQVASSDKLGSLSKVLRLNQEFIEQNQEQARTAAATAADKVDAWLDKLSTELRAQAARSEALEQRLHKCDEVLQALADAAQEDRERAASDADEQRALIFGCDARLEDMARWQNGVDSQMEELREIATIGLRKVGNGLWRTSRRDSPFLTSCGVSMFVPHRLKELGLVRESLSEKALKMEQALSEMVRGVLHRLGSDGAQERLTSALDVTAERAGAVGGKRTGCGGRKRLSRV